MALAWLLKGTKSSTSKRRKTSGVRVVSKRKSETEEACEFIRMLKEAYPKYEPLIFHICNEAGRSAISGALLNRMGRKKGVSDYFFSMPNKKYHGLYIELKTALGKPTEEQLEWIKLVEKHGYAARVAIGATEAFDIFSLYLKSAL